MLRKARTIRSALLLLGLLTVMIGLTLRQIHQARLNRDLITALWNCWHVRLGENNPRYALKALAALKAGADPNSWAYIDQDGSGKIEQATWREWFPLNLQFFGNKKYFRMSALELAVQYQDPQLVKALLDRGAKVYKGDKSAPLPFSLLGVAVLLGNGEIVNLLLDHGADINEQQTWRRGKTLTRRTPLMIAVSVMSDPDMVRLLIRRGAKVNLRTKEGKTALGLVLEDGPPQPSDKEIFQIVQMLKAAGAKK